MVINIDVALLLYFFVGLLIFVYFISSIYSICVCSNNEEEIKKLKEQLDKLENKKVKK